MNWLREECRAFIPTTTTTATTTSTTSRTTKRATSLAPLGSTIVSNSTIAPKEVAVKGIPAELIIGGLFGGVAVLAIILAIYFFIRKKMCKKEKSNVESKLVEPEKKTSGNAVKYTPNDKKDIDTLEKQPLNSDKDRSEIEGEDLDGIEIETNDKIK
ncbi:hypothetical protein ScPMuIL_009454 [Solemya velum]